MLAEIITIGDEILIGQIIDTNSVFISKELNKIGVLNFGDDRNPDMNRAWIMPAVALGVHFYRGSSPMEVNLKYGFGPIQNQKIDNFGQHIPRRHTTRANSLKLSFTYLLDN